MTQPDRRGGKKPGFWMAQAFIAMLAVALVFHLMTAGQAGNSVPATAKTVPPTSGGGKGTSPAGAVLSRLKDAPPERPAPATESSRQSGRGTGGSRQSVQGAPYRPDLYLTRLAQEENDFQWWDLDPSELTWLLANQRQVLTRDLKTLPESSGGLRVLQLQDGSFGALRGVRAGDILLDINGQELDGPLDVEDFLEDPVYSRSKGWRVRLRREGRILTVDYRSAP